MSSNNTVQLNTTFSKKNKKESSNLKRLFSMMDNPGSFIFSIVLLTIISSGATIFAVWISGFTLNKITNSFPNPIDMNWFWLWIWISIGSYLIVFLTSLIQGWIIVKVSVNLVYKLRWQAYLKLQKMPIGYYDSHSSGDLMSRLTNDITNISQALVQSIAQILTGIFTMVISLVIMLLHAPILTIIVIVIIPLLFSLMFILVKRAKPYFVKQQKDIGDLNGYIEEYISGQKVTSLFERQDIVIDKFEILNERLVKSAVKSQAISGFAYPYTYFITNMVYIFSYAIAALFIILNVSSFGVIDISGNAQISKEFSLGLLVTFVAYLRTFITPLGSIFGIFNVIQAGFAGLDRVYNIIDLVPYQEDPEAKEIEKIEGKVEFKNVSFSYVKDKPILKNISFTANKGDRIAIVGPTGAGKTTIVNLLSKFYDISDGELLIDGVDIRKIKGSSLRRNISIVLQDTFLFTDTVKANIHYGNLSATDEEVINAAKKANANHFVMQLEKGYDEVIKNNGEDLSAGQRQLLAIARAFMSDSNILILDEATSSVDTLTEKRIQEAMEKLMKEKTSFIIAHRLSTIRDATKILVIKDGSIVEQGNHDELMNKNGLYAGLYNSQAKGISESLLD